MFHSFFFKIFVKNYCKIVFDVVSTIKKGTAAAHSNRISLCSSFIFYLYVSV